MRYAFGPGHDGRVIAGVAQITLDSFSRDGMTENVHITVPPHDPASSEKLTKVFAVYAPAAPRADEDAQSYLNADGRYVGDVSIVDAAMSTAVTIAVANVPAGAWYVQTILQYEQA
ncbi:MAG: hypothetical protein JWN86_3605 [Planctomycetota bacterium]|nr:hypothetical protein [Planctomycetota bacterium]